jgi:transcription antitermination factor NusG
MTTQKIWFVLKTSTTVQRIRDIATQEKVKLFLPTYQVTEVRGKNKIQKEKSLTLDLFFVWCTVSDMDRICENHKVISPIFRRRKILPDTIDKQEAISGRYQSVPDIQMGYFMRTIELYNEKVPFFKPHEVDMTKGDIVRIIAGPLKGIEGILISEQGKDGGRVLVNIDDVVAIPTVSIQPEWLEILQFAPAGKHAYKKFDSFQKRLDTAISNHNTLLGLTETDIKAMTTFITRYRNLKTSTRNHEAKLLTFMIMAHRLLQHKHEDYMHMEKELTALKEKLTSKNTIEFINKYFKEA